MSKARANILIVLPRLPYPLSTGGDQAMYNGLVAVASDARVIVTYPVRGHETNVKERMLVTGSIGGGVEFIPYVYKERGFASFFDRTRRRAENLLFSSERNLFERMYSYERVPEGFGTFVCELIEKYSIDLVQVEMLRMASLVFSLPREVRKIFVHHELGFVRNELTMNSLGQTPERAAAVRASKALELAMLEEYDAVVTLSEIDKQKLEAQGLRTPVLSSFSVVTPYDGPALPPSQATSLSFLGPEVHTPNKLALDWFLSECWPELLASDPSYQLRVIGRWSDSSIKKFSSDNVHFLGFVPTLSSALAGTVMVVPLTVGSGIRMKILQAAGMGIPVVTTSVGCEGLGLTDGKDCLIADTSRDFVAAVRRMKDPSLRFSLAAAARERLSAFSLDALKTNRLEIYSRVLS